MAGETVVYGGAATSFLALTDTPVDYSGAALKVVRVNAGGTDLEFVTLAGGGDMLAANDLSDVADVPTSVSNLGLTIGVNTQAYDTGLTSIAGLTTLADRMIYTTASDTYAVTTLTAFGRSLIDDANATSGRSTLGLVIGVNVQAYDAGLLSIAALTTAADKMIYTTALDTYAVAALTAAARTLLDDASVSAMRTTLELIIGTDVQAYDVDTTKNDVANTFTAGQLATDTTTTYAASVALNLALSNDFTITLTGNLTLANPSAMPVGQSGMITLIQDITGSRTLALGAYFEVFGGGALPTLSTTQYFKDVLSYKVRSSTVIEILGFATDVQ